MTNNYELATFGGGCFWCVEAMYNKLNGVIIATSGYAGGTTENPTYQEVCTGTTGHAEVVQIKYNPNVIGYKELLGVFFKMHDPTSINRQGDDVGTQYRSIILYHTAEQKDIAESVINDLTSEKIYENDIVTLVEPFTMFYSAEDYHQDYFNNNPENKYCQLVVTPKIEKFKKIFKNNLKK